MWRDKHGPAHGWTAVKKEVPPLFTGGRAERGVLDSPPTSSERQAMEAAAHRSATDLYLDRKPGDFRRGRKKIYADLVLPRSACVHE